MSEITHISRNELTADEVIEIIDTGGRVIIEASVLGKSTRLVIRRHDGIYYCDTPMKLMKHETPAELRKCLERFRLTRSLPAEAGEVVETSA